MKTQDLKSPLIPASDIISGHMRTDFLTDAYQPRMHRQTMLSCHAVDTASHDNHKMPHGHEKGKLLKYCAHRDWIQPIPPTPKGLEHLYNQQYALAELNHLTVANGIAFSAGHMQGIAFFDGRAKGWYIANNHISTQSQHIITINGLICGEFFKNTTGKTGQLAPITLNPQKIAGSHNIWIISHKDKEDEYQKVGGENISDNRQNPTRKPGHTYLKNFDLKRFIDEKNEIPYPKGPSNTRTMRYCKTIADLAMNHGQKV